MVSIANIFCLCCIGTDATLEHAPIPNYHITFPKHQHVVEQDVGREEFRLGVVLYDQQRYSEAERLLQQVVDGRERTLGRDHAGTLGSKHWLGRTLYCQQRYSEAERLLQQAADG